MPRNEAVKIGEEGCLGLRKKDIGQIAPELKNSSVIHFALNLQNFVACFNETNLHHVLVIYTKYSNDLLLHCFN